MINQEKHKSETNHLKKASRILKACGYLFLVSVFSSIFLMPVLKGKTFLLDILLGGPIFLIVFLSPFGLYHSIKSFRLKEGSKVARFRIFYGHAFIFLLIILFTYIMILDISKLF